MRSVLWKLLIVVGVMAIAYGVTDLSGSTRRGGFSFRFPNDDRVTLTIGAGLVTVGVLGSRPRHRP